MTKLRLDAQINRLEGSVPCYNDEKMWREREIETDRVSLVTCGNETSLGDVRNMLQSGPYGKILDARCFFSLIANENCIPEWWKTGQWILFGGSVFYNKVDDDTEHVLGMRWDSVVGWTFTKVTVLTAGGTRVKLGPNYAIAVML